MLISEAKNLLRMSGYRLIKESVDIFEEVAEVLESWGYEKDEIKHFLKVLSTDVKDGYEEGMTAEEIAEMVTDSFMWFPKKNVDESYIYEGKSKCKSDKFAHREKVAYKNKKKYYEDEDEDDDDDLDEAFLEEGKSKPNGDKFAHKEKVAGRKPKDCCGKKGCKDCDEEDDDLDESIEDVPGLTRELRGQVGTDDWSDFKDEFRAKTLLLKKALTPKFVSELIKRTDFEIDEKDIKSYALDVIENANLDAKNPVDALQRKIRRHFTGI